MEKRAASEIMLIFMLLGMLMVAFSIQLVKAQSATRKAGVNAGYWIKYELSATWDSNDPDATTPQYILDSQQLAYFSNVVQSVSGTNITFNSIKHFQNGTEKSETRWIDVDSGHAGTGSASGYLSFIAANLSAGDLIYTGLGAGIGQINETMTRTYLGQPVEINHHNSTTSGTSYFIYSDAYWNRATGVLYEFYMNHTKYTTKGEETYVTQETQWLYPIGIIGVAKTWTVNDDGPADFHTIQEAINAARLGDTVLVSSGTYYEYVVVNKSISIIGENKTAVVINGSGSGIVLKVAFVSNMNLENLTLQNGYFGLHIVDSSHVRIRNVSLTNNKYNFNFLARTSQNLIHDIDSSNTVDGKPIYYWIDRQDEEVPNDAGFVALINCSGITVRDLTLSNNWGGITLTNVKNSLIKNVSISNTGGAVFMDSVVNSTLQNNVISKSTWGLHLSNSNANNIVDNVLTNNADNDALYLSSSHNNTIRRNLILNNTHAGIYLTESFYNIIRENNIMNNHYGIFLGHSLYNNLSENQLDENIAYGIRLFNSSYNWIFANNITGTKKKGWESGIELDYYSNNNRITENIIYNNVYGIQINTSQNNSIYHNNFINNTNQVETSFSVNVWDDGYPSGGNYWSDYKDRYPDAKEIDGSGIWDTPYVIYENNQDNYPLTSPGDTGEEITSPPPFWMQWWFWAIVAVIIVALAGTAYFLKKRKPPTPTAPAPPPEGTETSIE